LAQAESLIALFTDLWRSSTPAAMDAFKVQAQIRQNATEMQDFLKDLGSWEKNIKQRDRLVQILATALG
jgi:hypothetical protein